MTRRRLVATLAAAAASAGCSPVGVLNALARRDTYTRRDGIAYGPLARQKLDVYVPTDARPATGFPTVVFFYGGNWTSGERADYAFVGEALAARGVLVLVADYRLYPDVTYPDFLEDCAAALAWGLDHAAGLGGDASRVFVMGHSAGGYNAAMLALDARWLAARGHSPRQLAGWIGIAGAYDFFPLEDGQPARPVFHHPDYPARGQPIDDVSPASPPAFLGAPRHDRVVSPERSTLQMSARLNGAGVAVETKLYDRVSHALAIGVFARPLRGLAPVLDDVVAWIDRAPRVSA